VCVHTHTHTLTHTHAHTHIHSLTHSLTHSPLLPPCSPPQRQDTPLHRAARNNSVDAAKVLIDHNAQVDARDWVSLNPTTPGGKAQGTWQLGPGDARGFVCLQKLLAC
jgi:hypothetical protein